MTITDTPSSTVPSVPPPPPPPPTRPLTVRQAPTIVAAVLVSVGVVVLIAATAFGAVLTQRDSAGFFHTDRGTLRSAGYAITSQPDEFAAANPDVPASFDDVVTFRVRATSEADAPLFIGVAPRADVDRYLTGVAHDVVTEIETDPFRADSRSVTGTATPSAPGTQTFWTASTTGTGTQELRWNPDDSDWTVVVMNADGSREVVTQTDVGVRVDWLVQIAVGLAVLGALSAVSGAVVWFTLGRRPSN